MADDKTSWWQTVTGILTAIAGAITAVSGLLLGLQQVGWLGAERAVNTTSSSTPSAGASSGEAPLAGAPSAGAPAAGATGYVVEFPSGSSVILRNSRADGEYEALRARVEDRRTDTLVLTIAVRLTNKGRSDLAFSTDYFRLIVDGVPLAPTSFLNAAVDARSAKEAEITFKLPRSAASLILEINDGQDSGRIPLVVRRSG